MSARPVVLVTRALPAGWLERLDRLPGGMEVVLGPADRGGLDPTIEARLPHAAAILSLLTERIDEHVLARAPNLRVVSNMAVGVDNIDVDACSRRKIPVGHTPGVLTEATADLTMALLLSAARHLPRAAEDVKAGRWQLWSPTGWLGADLHGATLGILGMGAIGRAVAQRAHAFGLRIVYASRSAAPQVEAKLGARRLPMPELFSQADFVSVHVPLSADTHRLVGADLLGRMKPTAILVNTARGPIVDPVALRHALEHGKIAAAALDVTDPEPLPPSDPLLSAPNLLVVPHIGSATHGTRKRMAQLACDNLVAGLRGEPLPHCVNAEALARVT
jgi:glyoxylate reductase